jgi:NAD-specific glutamate dehydrogenase
MFPALDVVDVAHEMGVRRRKGGRDSPQRRGRSWGCTGWRAAIARDSTDVHWHRLAAVSALDEIYRVLRAITGSAIAADMLHGMSSGPDPAARGTGRTAAEALADWTASRPDAVARLRQIVSELRGTAALDWAMIGVALREARALVEAA